MPFSNFEMMNALAVALLLAAAPPTSLERVDLTRDVAYGPDARYHRLDVYRVPSDTAKPLLVFIHGGGWSEGDKGTHPRRGNFFARQGFVYATINYRLSPAVKHPAHVEDVAKAIAFLHANAAKFGIDPERIILVGHSAGAHLAALVATAERHLDAEQSSTAIIDAVVLLDGAGYDLVTRVPSSRGWSRSMFLNAFGEDPAVWEDASPARHVEAGRRPPAFLLFHVKGRKAAAQQADAFARALRSVGAHAEMVEVTGRNHATIVRRLGLGDDPVARRLLQFARDQLPSAQGAADTAGTTGSAPAPAGGQSGSR